MSSQKMSAAEWVRQEDARRRGETVSQPMIIEQHRGPYPQPVMQQPRRPSAQPVMQQPRGPYPQPVMPQLERDDTISVANRLQGPFETRPLPGNQEDAFIRRERERNSRPLEQNMPSGIATAIVAGIAENIRAQEEGRRRNAMKWRPDVKPVRLSALPTSNPAIQPSVAHVVPEDRRVRQLEYELAGIELEGAREQRRDYERRMAEEEKKRQEEYYFANRAQIWAEEDRVRKERDERRRREREDYQKRFPNARFP